MSTVSVFPGADASRKTGMPEHARGGEPGVIESAFCLLKVLRSLGQLPVAELTRQSGLPRTTVSRLLRQLAEVGAVERVGTRYRLGPYLLSLGQHVTPVAQLRTVAQRPLIELAAAIPAHVALVSISGTVPIYLDVLPGRSQLPLRCEPGEPTPPHSAAERVLRSRGVLAIDDALISGVSCAAHLLNLPGGDLAALTIIVPMLRLPRGLIAPLQTTAARITTQLAEHSSGTLP
jgi:IclR family transcriptional regulator, acetate operon repressor